MRSVEEHEVAQEFWSCFARHDTKRGHNSRRLGAIMPLGWCGQDLDDSPCVVYRSVLDLNVFFFTVHTSFNVQSLEGWLHFRASLF